jgi:hypothetical protein
MAIYPKTPWPFSFSPTEFPPLYSLSYISIRPYPFKLYHKNNPAPLQLDPWAILVKPSPCLNIIIRSLFLKSKLLIVP